MTAETDDESRMPLTSHDVLGERVERLKDLFPEAFSEGQIDFDRLRNALGDFVGEGRERYGLSWAGKADAIRALQAPSVGTLLPCPEESVNWDSTENVFIEGDNLEVLKLLQKSYYGKVKMIYIDPPYNTGNEFIYPDNFKEGLDDYLKYSGQVNDEGIRLSTNAEGDGRYHSKWLSMMYPRMFLARNLLRQDGFLVVTIDDHEVHNLRLLLDEIFGVENFIACAVWQKAYVANMTAKFISSTHDYVLIYARDSTAATVGRLDRTPEQIAKFNQDDGDGRGPWKPENLSAGKFYAAGQFPITTPAGKEVTPPPGRYWRCNEERYEEWLADGRITFGKDGLGRPMLKKYLSEMDEGLTPSTWWTHQEFGSNKQASTQLKALFDGRAIFDTPKPVKLVEMLLQLFADRDSLVLDFFAGVGATAEAVLSKNADDGGARRFLLVQLPEPVGDDEETIASICRERIERVLKQHQSDVGDQLEFDSDDLDVGFRTFSLASSNFKTWKSEALGVGDVKKQLKLTAIRKKDGASQRASLTELILKAGLGLTPRGSTTYVEGCEVHMFSNGLLAVCLEQSLSPEFFSGIRDLQPERLLCLDAAFDGNDELKTNTVLEMKSHGIEFRTV